MTFCFVIQNKIFKNDIQFCFSMKDDTLNNLVFTSQKGNETCRANTIFLKGECISSDKRSSVAQTLIKEKLLLYVEHEFKTFMFNDGLLFRNTMHNLKQESILIGCVPITP